MYINRCSSPILSDQTPYEQLFGTPPNYSPLKVFGYVHFGLVVFLENKIFHSLSHFTDHISTISHINPPPNLFPEHLSTKSTYDEPLAPTSNESHPFTLAGDTIGS